MQTSYKIGLGGGCHWCTEAVFQSLRGVLKVEQGFIAPLQDKTAYSEAVIVHYDPKQIQMDDLIAIHLHTHASTSNHQLREKYRSAIYVVKPNEYTLAKAALHRQQQDFDQQLVTQVYHFGSFKASDEAFHNYFYTNPEKPFCQTHISPKLSKLMRTFSRLVAPEKLSTLHESL